MTMLLLAALLLASEGPREDRTAIALERCLASPKAAPAPQPQPEDGGDASDDAQPQVMPEGRADGRATCFENARGSYDRRIVDVYRSLLRKASPDEAEWLSQANQAWLTYRQQASGEVDGTAAARDHALWLESLKR